MAARSVEVILRGKVKWAYTRTLSKYDDYRLVLYPDADSLIEIKKLQELGIKNVLKKDDDGYNMNFLRKPDGEDRHGRKFQLGPPQVFNADKTPFEGYIGNGSDVTIMLECYGGENRMKQKYYAARLKGVKVETLVPWNPESIDPLDSYEKKKAMHLADAPLQKPSW